LQKMQKGLNCYAALLEAANFEYGALLGRASLTREPIHA
jgi:hypothetical protein